MKSLTLLTGIFIAFVATASEWTEPKEVRMRRDKVVSYRATLAGDTLVIEATHEDGWHSYAMDNRIRAREASGKETPECELPTRIEVSGPLTVVGPWRQSNPADLSNTDINWFTFGFNNVAYFATTVKREGDGEATVRIHAQACNASKCSMVDGLELVLPVSGDSEDADSPVDLGALVEVAIETPAE